MDLNDKNKQDIKDLWTKGLSRDKISITLGIGKDSVQSYINYIKSSYIKEREKNISGKPLIENKSIDLNEILNDYKSGASYLFLKDKYHIGTAKVDTIVKEHTELLDEHNKNAIKFGKEHRKEYIKNMDIDTKYYNQYVKSQKHISHNKFFNRKISNFQYKLYCKLEFKNDVQIYTNATDPSKYGNMKRIPRTKIMTKGIKGLHDFDVFISIRQAHKFDVVNEYCYNVSNNTVYSIGELAGKIGYNLE